MAHSGDHTNSQPQDSAESEQRPLLRSFPNPSGYNLPHLKTTDQHAISTRLKHHLTAEVDTQWTELILIVCFFISGMIDAGAYNAYECFCSMQTGNTIFAALGVSDLPVSSPKLAWTKSVASVLAFLLGAVATASFHRHFGETKRWVLASSFALQTLLIVVAGVLVYRGNSSGSPVLSTSQGAIATIPADPGFPWFDLIPIALLAFQASAKVITSRMLSLNALPVVVLTTLYADLISDPSLFSAGLFDNTQRNRRFGGAMLYFVGAVLGGVAASHAIGFSGGLFIAAGLQATTVIAWLAWKADQDYEGVQEDGIATDDESRGFGDWGGR